MFFQACRTSLSMWAWLFLPALFWLPEVQGIKCDQPKVENGKILNLPQPSYTYNDAISFECNSGYSAVGSLHIKCGANSSWVPDVPKCVKVKKCPTPQIENSNTSAYHEDDLLLGGTITVSCLHGYRPVGQTTFTCIVKDGKLDWNGAFPICELIPCNRPETIVNGYFDPDHIDEYYFGSVVIYRCQRDFSLIGNSTLTCIITEDGLNGKWSSPVPECKNVKCDLPKVENGEILNLPQPSYTYNDAISFECNSGYSAVGSLHIKCGANSSWVPDVPKCVKVEKCPTPQIENSNTSAYHEDDLLLGGTITVSCLHGYRPVGETTLKCIVKDGKVDWHVAFPICEQKVGEPNTITDKPNTTTKDYAEYHKTTALGKLIILLAALYNCW